VTHGDPSPPSGRFNRLKGETSPYLLQHAANPVDWHPWGDEALSRARELDRPIFLSIGYSACHWCHVMEHESFEDAGIAELMNRYFVNIKVDREERPDLDQIYMNAVTALTGRGGWPMSVFLTPDLRPFFGGTYWPPDARMGMPGFRDVVQKVHEAWVERRGDVDRGAAELTEAVVLMSTALAEPSPLSDDLPRNALSALLRAADRQHGGFGGAPKFPHPMDLRVLLRGWRRFGSEDALGVVRLTLDKMSQGGIYDHLGGGFHRYSTDARWLVPHFEKMLYDNALLVSTYVEAFQATGDPNYARVVRETIDYVLREMTDAGGAFYSTQDADSEGVEGKFFVWSEREIADLLGPADAEIFGYCYDVSPQGNWEGANILNRVKTHAQAARVLNLSEEDLHAILARSREKLFAARSQRVPPGRDEKILVSWNGLMIAALAQAARALDDAAYARAAERAADFLLQNLRDSSGKLLHTCKDGRARLNAYLDDYAALVDGLVELFQATGNTRHLNAALDLSGRLVESFHDANQGGFFYTSHDHEALIARQKDSQDGATPSGNGMAATALLKLARLTGRDDLERYAVATLESLSGQLARIPMAGGQSLIALDFLLGPAHEVVLVESRPDAGPDGLAQMLDRQFLPNAVVVRRQAGQAPPASDDPLASLLAGKVPLNDRETAYVCARGTCQAPTTEAAAMLATLNAR